jgi:hypothetical protein
MDIYESRDSCGVFSTNFQSPHWELELVALADAFNFAVANQNSGVVKLRIRSNCLADV